MLRRPTIFVLPGQSLVDAHPVTQQTLCQEITPCGSFRKLWPGFTINASRWESNFLLLGADATMWSAHWSLTFLSIITGDSVRLSIFCAGCHGVQRWDTALPSVTFMNKGIVTAAPRKIRTRSPPSQLYKPVSWCWMWKQLLFVLRSIQNIQVGPKVGTRYIVYNYCVPINPLQSN